MTSMKVAPTPPADPLAPIHANIAASGAKGLAVAAQVQTVADVAQHASYEKLLSDSSKGVVGKLVSDKGTATACVQHDEHLGQIDAAIKAIAGDQSNPAIVSAHAAVDEAAGALAKTKGAFAATAAQVASLKTEATCVPPPAKKEKPN